MDKKQLVSKYVDDIKEVYDELCMHKGIDRMDQWERARRILDSVSLREFNEFIKRASISKEVVGIAYASAILNVALELANA